MGFPWQENGSGLQFPSPGDLRNPGTEPRSPALQANSLPLSHLGSPNFRDCGTEHARLLPQPWIEPVPPAVRHSLNRWTICPYIIAMGKDLPKHTSL